MNRHDRNTLHTSLDRITHAFTNARKSKPSHASIMQHYMDIRSLTQAFCNQAAYIGTFEVFFSEGDMAKKFNGWTFADIKLDSSDKLAFDSWVKATDPDILELLQELHTQGYKVSSSFSAQNEAFCVTITGTDDCKYNRGVSLTSWSDELKEAFQIAAYKHFVISKETAWALPEKNKKAWG